MKITDSLTLDASGLTLTRDGFLVGDAKVSRAGNVQQYYGSELGLTGDEAAKLFGVFRDPDVVFDEASMLSLAGRPVTRGHPPAGVNADNWAGLVKGQMGGVIRRDGEHVVAPMAIMDAAAVKEVGEGARSLSAGYTVDVLASEGIAADGTPYQFRQAGALRFNHVAYLPDNNPRAGNTRIGDVDPLRWGAAPILPTTDKEPHSMSDALRTVIVDGLSVSTTDQGAQAITTLLQRIADAATKAATTDTAHLAAIAAKDTLLAQKDAEIDGLKAKVLDAAAIDKLVADRAGLVAAANTIAKDVNTDGLSEAAIRKAVVIAKLGDAAVAGKADAYIDARFDILVDEAKAGGVDPFRAAVKDGIQPTSGNGEAAHRAMTDHLQSAWQNPTGKAA